MVCIVASLLICSLHAQVLFQLSERPFLIAETQLNTVSCWVDIVDELPSMCQSGVMADHVDRLQACYRTSFGRRALPESVRADIFIWFQDMCHFLGQQNQQLEFEHLLQTLLWQMQKSMSMTASLRRQFEEFTLFHSAQLADITELRGRFSASTEATASVATGKNPILIT